MKYLEGTETIHTRDSFALLIAARAKCPDGKVRKVRVWASGYQATARIRGKSVQGSLWLIDDVLEFSPDEVQK